MKQVNNKTSLLMATGVVLCHVLEKALAHSPSPPGVYSPSDGSSSGVFSDVNSIVYSLGGLSVVVGCCLGCLRMCAKCDVPSCCDSSDDDNYDDNYQAMESGAPRPM